MKRTFKPLATALAATLQLAATAAVPLAWDVRPGQPAPVMFDRYHGETLGFSATFRGFGELPFAAGADVRLWYQTNGMGQAWWSVPATIQSNVLSAVWSPEMDPGAERVSLFFGAPSNAYAAAVLRLRHSPGFAPGAMPDPESFRESDPVFAAWLATFEVPETSLEPATNYTDRALGAFAATGSVARAATYGTPTRWTDATGCVWAVSAAPGTGYADWICTGVPDRYSFLGVDPDPTSAGMWRLDLYEKIELEIYPVYTFGGENPALLMFDVDGARVVALPKSTVTNLVGRVALTNDIPPATDLSPIEEEIADIRTESSLVYRLYSGSNVVAEVTNYNSQVHAPELRLMQLNESNEYITVWTETNGLARTLAKANEYTDAAITNRAAPRAWSKVTAGMGFEAPSNTTWLSTGRTVIAGGLEYEKHMTSGGAIWLLESNGMTADFHAQTNNTAFIDLSNADGTPIFRVEKTDSFLVGVHVDRVSIDGSALVCGVNVVAADHPLVRVKASLESGEWAKEEDGIPASLATVTWSGTTGDWTCRIQNNTGGNTLFAQMEYFQEGGTKIVNSAAMDVSQGILCTDGIHKCRPVYSSAGGGTITWEVVQ